MSLATKDEEKLLFPKLFRVVSAHKDKIFNNSKIGEKNKEHLKRFFKHCEAKGLSVGRMAFLHEYLLNFALWAGKRDFLKLSRGDIDDYIAGLRKTRGKSTMNGYISVLKSFYRHMNGLTSIDTAPEPVRHLQKERADNFIRKEMLLTDGEIDRLFQLAKELRWKAVLSALLCGLRPSEIRSLKMGDVSIDTECIKIRVSGGKMSGRLLPRTVFVTKGSQFMMSWILSHPKRDNPNGFLFSKEIKGVGFVPLGDSEFRSALRRLTSKAGVSAKMCCAYGFRHKVLTDWYTNPNLGYENARRLAGHSAGSRMSEIYCHVDDEGLKRVFFSSEKNALCPKCGNANPPNSEYCSRCGFCFNTKKLVERQTAMETMGGNGLDALEYFINKNPELLRELIGKWKGQKST